MKCILLAGLSFMAIMLSAPAQAQDIDDIFALDVETLLNVKVVTTSKRDETLIEAPGIVTVITKEDIKRYGGKSLLEVISRLPNMDIVRPPLMPTGIGGNIRGQVPKGIPNHLLTLLDGRPFRESQLGGWDQSFYQGFPLEMIEKIEMIRGPGSVLYGTNAFSGVINIVTKKPENITGEHAGYVSAGYGSFNTKFSDASYRFHAPDHDFSLSAAVKYYDTQGWSYDVVDINGVDDRSDLARDALGGFVRARYKNLTITGFNGQTENDTQGLAPVWPMGTHKQKRQFWDIGYVQPLGDDWKANFNVTYNGFENFATARGTALDENEFNDILYEVSVAGAPYRNVNIVAGAIYDDRQGTLKLGSTDFKEAMENYYLQADFKPKEWLKFIGGIQLNKPESFESYDTSLRAGAIMNFTPEIGAKALYGEAFRAPTASETRLDIPGVTGNPDLKSEEITTKEIQFFYNTQRYFAAATYYESDIENPIATGPNPDAPPAFTFLNGNEQKYKGIEFEGKALITENFEMQGSLTYQWGENPRTGNRDITLAPHFMFKLGGSYVSDKGFSIGIYNQHIGDTVGYPTVVLPTAKPNPTVDNTNLLTANLSFDVNEILDLPQTMPDTTFNIYGDNLLDEDIYVSDISDGIANNTIPGYGGRAFYASVSFKF